jgi:hypothetical protein
MALIYDGRTVAGNAAVDTQTKSFRVNNIPRSYNTYATSGVTGTIAAALAGNSTVFAMRLDPGSGTRLAYIQRIRLEYTTIVAYTTPVTAGRRLALFRGSGAAASSGTAITVGVRKDTGLASTSEFDAANGGDIRIASTGALTVTGITYETDPIKTATLSHVGAAGGYSSVLWEFYGTDCAPLVLQPGQLIGIRNPAAMDAAGTWQLGVNIDWIEATAYNATTE